MLLSVTLTGYINNSFQSSDFLYMLEQVRDLMSIMSLINMKVGFLVTFYNLLLKVRYDRPTKHQTLHIFYGF